MAKNMVNNKQVMNIYTREKINHDNQYIEALIPINFIDSYNRKGF